MLFTFAKPEGFSYQAGQTVDVTLVNPSQTDAEGNSRTFSLVSAPHESGISIATRMRDTAFKRVLKDLPEGSEILVDGPFGSFTLHENDARPAVFLSGGIGITPFHSMVKDAAERHLPHTLFLFYSNRTPKDAAFLSELQGLATSHAAFHLVATMTNIADDIQWEGERGYITKDMIERYVPQGISPIFYLAGPETMVTAMRELLHSMGVSKDDIRFEEFAGY